MRSGSRVVKGIFLGRCGVHRALFSFLFNRFFHLLYLDTYTVHIKLDIQAEPGSIDQIE